MCVFSVAWSLIRARRDDKSDYSSRTSAETVACKSKDRRRIPRRCLRVNGKIREATELNSRFAKMSVTFAMIGKPFFSVRFAFAVERLVWQIIRAAKNAVRFAFDLRAALFSFDSIVFFVKQATNEQNIILIERTNHGLTGFAWKHIFPLSHKFIWTLSRIINSHYILSKEKRNNHSLLIHIILNTNESGNEQLGNN